MFSLGWEDVNCSYPMSSTIPERKTRMCSEYGLARITSSDVWSFLSINLDISHSNLSSLQENFLVFKHLKGIC